MNSQHAQPGSGQGETPPLPDSREAVYQRIRSALAPLQERTPYPDWVESVTATRQAGAFDSPWETFCDVFRSVNGTTLEGWRALAEYLAQEGLQHGYCDPALEPAFREAAHTAGLEVETEMDLARIDDYQFGISRAAGAIAISGSLVFKDKTTSRRLAALAPWAHAAVLTTADIVPDLPAGIRALGDDPNIVWATGPSKTADIEGILIEGVHGPGVQIACLIEDLPPADS